MTSPPRRRMRTRRWLELSRRARRRSPPTGSRCAPSTAAYAGEEELARTAARQALERAGSTTGRPAEQFATAALGLLELSLERDAEAVEALAPLVAFARGHEMREPGLTRFVPDLVEALVGLGRLDEAEDNLAWYTGNAERLHRRSALGSAARGRGFVSAARGDTETAVTCFDEAVAHHREAPIPFDRGRSLLALGAARRRAKERRAARESLLEARELFGGLGARLWEQRAAAELARIGGRAPSAGELTPVETARRRARRRRTEQQGGRGRALSQHPDRGGASLPGLREARRPLARRARAQTRVEAPFFARPPPPSLELSTRSRIEDPERRRT